MSAWKDKRNVVARETDQALAGACRGAAEQQLERLKEQLLRPVLASIENAALIRELRWVANEAAGLAWFTVCPMLFLPALLEEKISAALRRWERQQLLWKGRASAKVDQETHACASFGVAVMAAA